MLCLCLDEQLGGSEPVRGKAPHELICKPHGAKGQRVGPVRGWVDLPASRQVRRRIAQDERSLVETLGKAVGKAAFRSEPGQHCTLVQPCELTQRADPEPPENVGKLGQAENLHWEVTEPLWCRTSRHDHAVTRR
jgi:hypothetical protein